MQTRPVDIDLIRGGTSKGVFMSLEDLPGQPARRNPFVLAIMGSPDPMQLDGLGGTHSSTSKLMAVASASRARQLGYEVADDVDAVYLFGQVGVDVAVVDWQGDCGNLTSGVALYAIRHGLVAATGTTARVRLLNLNTGSRVTCEVPVADGIPLVEGDYSMPGVPGTGARIDVVFERPASMSRSLLPTGRVLDEVTVGGRQIDVTLLDVVNPVVFIYASDLGIAGSERSMELNADLALLRQLEDIRGAAAVMCGLVEDAADARLASPAIPRVILVAPPHEHLLESGETVSAPDADIVVRTTSMGRIHHALTGSGLIAAGVAMHLSGSVAHRVTTRSASDRRLAHPKGVVSVGVDLDGWDVRSVTLQRTARHLLTGTVEVRTSRI